MSVSAAFDVLINEGRIYNSAWSARLLAEQVSIEASDITLTHDLRPARGIRGREPVEQDRYQALPIAELSSAACPEAGVMQRSPSASTSPSTLMASARPGRFRRTWRTSRISDPCGRRRSSSAL